MYDGLIPQRYAMALFKYTLDRHSTKQVYDQMKQVIASFENNPDLNKVLANPFVGREDKQKLLVAAVGNDAGQDYKSFVNLILAHNREMFAYQMALAFRKIYRKENKISSVVITTAVPMSDSERNRITGLVQKVYADRVLETVVNVDGSLIGGFVIDVDNNRMDASVSNEIEQLRHNLISSN